MAVTLATFTIYVAIRGTDVSEPLLQASELGAKRTVAMRETVQIDGIAAGPISGTEGERMEFYVTDRDGGNRTLVQYEGAVPDAFRIGRNVLIKGQLEQGAARGDMVFAAEPGSLVTRCPSKFETEGGTSRSAA
jgi:cytochrome c-type biogenesis protein CcmE